MGHPRYSTEEIAIRGREIYEQRLRQKLERDNIEHLETQIRALPLPDRLWLMERMVRQIRNQTILIDTARASQLAAMAADPQIQQELRQIEADFAGTEDDGLPAM